MSILESLIFYTQKKEALKELKRLLLIYRNIEYKERLKYIREHKNINNLVPGGSREHPVPYSNIEKLNPWWLVGFIDGEGSFGIYEKNFGFEFMFSS